MSLSYWHPHTGFPELAKHFLIHKGGMSGDACQLSNFNDVQVLVCKLSELYPIRAPQPSTRSEHDCKQVSVCLHLSSFLSQHQTVLESTTVSSLSNSEPSWGTRSQVTASGPPRTNRFSSHTTNVDNITVAGLPRWTYHVPHAWPLGIIEVGGLGAAEVVIPLGPFFHHLLLDPLHLSRETSGECFVSVTAP